MNSTCIIKGAATDVRYFARTEAVAQRRSVKKVPATLFKKRHWHRCFPVNFEKFLRTPFFTEHLWWLLLQGVSSLGVQAARKILA